MNTTNGVQHSFPFSRTRTTPAWMITKHLTVSIIIGHAAAQQTLLFASFMRFTGFGTTFQPRHLVEWLLIIPNVPSVLRCGKECNQITLCRTFDYDRQSLVCRLFEGEFFDRNELDQRYLALIENRLHCLHGWSLRIVQSNMWSVQQCKQSIPAVYEQCLSMLTEYVLEWSNVFESIIQWINLCLFIGILSARFESYLF